jgi:hypothetical protein
MAGVRIALGLLVGVILTILGCSALEYGRVDRFDRELREAQGELKNRDPDPLSGDQKDTASPRRVGETIDLVGGTTYRVLDFVRTTALGGVKNPTRSIEGRFLVVKLEVRNGTADPMTMIDDNAILVGGDGETYSVSNEGMLATEEDTLLLDDFNPGESKRGTLVYDAPPEALAGARLQLEDLTSDATTSVGLSGL